MNRTGLIIALVIAAVNGLVFGLSPEIELSVAQHFHDVVDAGNNTFAWRIYPPLMLARDIGLWVGTAIIIPVLAALAFKLIVPTRKMLIPGRAVVFLIATLALGPGLLVNVVLKDHWGRSRPIDITSSAAPSITSVGGTRAAIAQTTAPSCPATSPARSGPSRRRRLRRRSGASWPMARGWRSAPAWPRCG